MLNTLIVNFVKEHQHVEPVNRKRLCVLAHIPLSLAEMTRTVCIRE